MFVEMTIVLDVEEQDSTNDAIEAAQNQLHSMDAKDIINMLTYAVIP